MATPSTLHDFRTVNPKSCLSTRVRRVSRLGNPVARSALPSPRKLAVRGACVKARGHAVFAALSPDSTYDALERIKVDLSAAPDCKFFRVEAIIRPWRLQFVIDSLVNGGIKGMTITQAYGIGAQGGEMERYAGNEFQGNQVVEKTKLEVIAVREQVDFIVKKITVAAHTGENGDGKIFIHPVADAVRIRTGETGANAEKMAGGRSDLLSTGSIDEGVL